jgi:uncharacterized protein
LPISRLDHDQHDILLRLEQRLGRRYARQRLGIEHDYEGQLVGGGINFFHIENWYSLHSLIKLALKMSGLFGRGIRNTAEIEVRHNSIKDQAIPEAFRGYTILHISDLHVDINAPAVARLIDPTWLMTFVS